MGGLKNTNDLNYALIKIVLMQLWGIGRNYVLLAELQIAA